MPINELDPGERYSFAPVPMRIRVTGVPESGGVRLDIVDGAGGQAAMRRLSTTEVILLPQVGRFSLNLKSAGAPAFAHGLRLGLDFRNELAQGGQEQIVLTAHNVGALAEYAIAVLDMGELRADLAVADAHEVVIPDAGTPTRIDPIRLIDEPEPASEVAPSKADWAARGRDAYRAVYGAQPQSRQAWAVCLDASASMLLPQRTGALLELVELTAGVMQTATATGPVALRATPAGRPISVPVSSQYPRALVSAAFDQVEPRSSARLAPAIAGLAQELPEGGVIVVVSDGVPSDIDEVAAIISERPNLRTCFVAFATSSHGLPGQLPTSTWQEELTGLSAIAGPRCRVIAVQPVSGIDTDGKPLQVALQPPDMNAFVEKVTVAARPMESVS